jgi:hypothetical protein
MKRIQILFAVLALFVAGIGVFAKAAQPFVQYYEEPNAATFNCTTQLQTTPCDVGTNSVCVVALGTKWVTYKNASNVCVSLLKP